MFLLHVCRRMFLFRIHKKSRLTRDTHKAVQSYLICSLSFHSCCRSVLTFVWNVRFLCLYQLMCGKKKKRVYVVFLCTHIIYTVHMVDSGSVGVDLILLSSDESFAKVRHVRCSFSELSDTDEVWRHFNVEVTEQQMRRWLNMCLTQWNFKLLNTGPQLIGSQTDFFFYNMRPAADWPTAPTTVSKGNNTNRCRTPTC